jgi:hypothetical protein
MKDVPRITREIRSPSVNVVGALILQGAKPLGVAVHSQTGVRMVRFAVSDQPLLDAYNKARDAAALLLNDENEGAST